MDKINKKIILVGFLFMVPFGLFKLMFLLGLNPSRNHFGELPGILEILAFLSYFFAFPVGLVIFLFGIIKAVFIKIKK